MKILIFIIKFSNNYINFIVIIWVISNCIYFIKIPYFLIKYFSLFLINLLSVTKCKIFREVRDQIIVCRLKNRDEKYKSF